MKISFFGSSLVSAYWNGAATFYRGLIRALHERGHRITFYEPDVYDRQKHRDIPNPSWAKVVVYAATEESALEKVEEAYESDLVIKCSGVGVFDDLLDAAILEVQSPETLVAFLDVDAHATLDRIQANPDDPFRSLIPEYDFVLTHGGGKPVVDAYTKAGARECVPMYNAFDPHTHFAVQPDPRFSGDLGFLGNRVPDREERVEEFFLKPAGLLAEKTFLLGGNGWEDKALPGNVKYLGHVYTRDHNAFNCSTLAVLNVSRGSMARYGFSPATRVFEAAGAGACLLTDKWDGIEMFLEPGREVLVAATGEEIAEHIRNLTPDRAREIGLAAQARVIAAHTYTHRAVELEKILARKSDGITA